MRGALGNSYSIVDPNQGRFAPLGGTRQCLETFSVVITEGAGGEVLLAFGKW